MIGRDELADAMLDGFSQHDELVEAFDPIRAARVDDDASTALSWWKAEHFEQALARLSEQGMPYAEALRLILAACWVDGLILGVRAQRREGDDG